MSSSETSTFPPCGNRSPSPCWWHSRRLQRWDYWSQRKMIMAPTLTYTMMSSTLIAHYAGCHQPPAGDDLRSSANRFRIRSAQNAKASSTWLHSFNPPRMVLFPTRASTAAPSLSPLSESVSSPSTPASPANTALAVTLPFGPWRARTAESVPPASCHSHTSATYHPGVRCPRGLRATPGG